MEHRQDPDLNHEVTQPRSISLFYEETVMKWVLKKMFFPVNVPHNLCWGKVK